MSWRRVHGEKSMMQALCSLHASTSHSVIYSLLFPWEHDCTVIAVEYFSEKLVTLS